MNLIAASALAGVALLALTTALIPIGSAQTVTSKSSQCAVAAGHDISHSTINVTCLNGMTAAQLRPLIRAIQDDTDRARVELAAASMQLGVRAALLRQLLIPLGIANVPDDQLEIKVAEGIARINHIQQQSVPQIGDSVAVIALKAQVKTALDQGQFDNADSLLARLEQLDDQALNTEMAERAAASAQRGELAMSQLHYLDAATHFADAARFTLEPNRNLSYLWEEAHALLKQGDEFGDNDALRDSIARWNALIRVTPRESHRDDWAAMQNNLGISLQTLGRNEGSTEEMTEAIVAYRNALLEQTRIRTPLDWARTENNLGDALAFLGEREAGSLNLLLAVMAYENALLELTRTRVPLDWAATQNNLGNALANLSAREVGTQRLTRAVAVYEDALLERTRGRVPLDWAQTQNNLGIALRMLGERERGTQNLTRAVAALENALLERTRIRVPLDWAQTQNNLGNALEGLGEREGGTRSLRFAVAAFQNALLVWTRQRAPLGWGQISMVLAGAEALIASRQRNAAMLAKAMADFADSEPYFPDGSPYVGVRDAAFKRIAEAQMAIAGH